MGKIFIGLYYINEIEMRFPCCGRRIYYL